MGNGMIRLTLMGHNADGKPYEDGILVQLRNVTYIVPMCSHGEEHACVYTVTGGRGICVKETVEEIVCLIDKGAML